MFLKVLQISHKVANLRPASLVKRDSSTCVFLWNLRSFQEQLFEEHLRTTAPEETLLFDVFEIWNWSPVRSSLSNSYFQKKPKLIKLKFVRKLNFHRLSRNPVRQLAFLQKYLKPLIFFGKAPSWMYKKVLNTPLEGFVWDSPRKN